MAKGVIALIVISVSLKLDGVLSFFQQCLRNTTKKTSASLLTRKRRWLTTTKGELYRVIRF